MSTKIIQHILVPTDFSVSSAKAIQSAFQIARATGAKITILHVIDPIFDVAAEAENMKQMRLKSAKENFKQQKSEREKTKYRDLEVTDSIKEGDILPVILTTAKNSGADLIVMGSIGATGIKRVLFGSTAVEVMRQAQVPVLVIPDSDKKTEFKTFLFTTDFRPKDPQNLILTKRIADEFNAGLTVLHIVEKLDFKSEILHRGFIDYIRDTIGIDKLTFELRQHQDIPRAISEYVSEKTVSAIVMNRYQKSLLDIILGRDTAEKMIGYEKTPLLILP
jgi:nucleotide-binding universal stress UspA family protein